MSEEENLFDIDEETIQVWRINYGLDERSPADAMRWWETNLGSAPSGAVAALGLCLDEIEKLQRTVNEKNVIIYDHQAQIIDDLRSKLQFLVNSWPLPLEDGGIAFPDGDFLESTRVEN